MDAIQLFLRDHARTHSSRLEAQAEISQEDLALRGLADDQLRLRPHDLNSIVWILWHVARCEDVAVNVLVAGRPQVLDEQDWLPRLRVSRRDIGTGMTDEEVAALSAAISVPDLRAYRLAVGRQTREVAQALTPEVLDEVPDPARLRQAVAQGALGPNAGWVEKFWEGKTKAWFLSWTAAGHNHMHLGHARWVRKLLLRPT